MAGPKFIPPSPSELISHYIPIGGDPGGTGGGGGGGRRVPPPLDFWKLEKHLFIYFHFKHNESNTKRLIQHKMLLNN